jgi:hypothetical protein
MKPNTGPPKRRPVGAGRGRNPAKRNFINPAVLDRIIGAYTRQGRSTLWLVLCPHMRGANSFSGRLHCGAAADTPEHRKAAGR